MYYNKMEFITVEELTDTQKEKALFFYVNHLNRLKKYNNSHKKEINEKSKQRFKKIKENPESYDLYKERKRQLYKSKKQTAENDDLTLIN